MAAPGLAYKTQKDEIDSAIQAVLNSGQYILGQSCSEFEQAFAHYVDRGHGIGVASGTDALRIALQACGVAEQDAVITAGNTAGATIAAIENLGAIPILADVDESTLTLCPESTKAAIKRWQKKYRIRALVPVHLYGQPAAMGPLLQVAAQFDLLVVEDACQAHGARLNDQPVGTFGHAAAFSFYPTKNLGAFGDAGMVVTHDERVDARARSLREYGWEQRQVSVVKGTNARMDEIQAAILKVRLKALPRENARRQTIANQFMKAFESIPTLRMPINQPSVHHVYHQFVSRHGARDEIRARLSHAGIDTAVLYPLPIHLQPAWSGLPLAHPEGLAVCEKAATEIFGLPVHPFLLDDEVERIIQAVEQSVG